MRPIVGRLKNENGDETLLEYARENRVDLFELTCFVQVYHSLTEMERQNMWRVFAQLAALAGIGHMGSHRLFNGVTAIAQNIAKNMNGDELNEGGNNPMANIGAIFKKLVNDPKLTSELHSTFGTLIDQQNANETTDMMLDLVEGSGIVTYEERMRAETKKQQKENKEVTIHHTGKKDEHDDDNKGGGSLNDIARQMLQNQNTATSINDLMSSMMTAEEQTSMMQEEKSTKPQRTMGDVIAEVMTSVPKTDSQREGVNQIFEALTSTSSESQRIKQSIVESAQQMVNGDLRGVLGNVHNIVATMKSEDGLGGVTTGATHEHDVTLDELSREMDIAMNTWPLDELRSRIDISTTLAQWDFEHMDNAPFKA